MNNEGAKGRRIEREFMKGVRLLAPLSLCCESDLPLSDWRWMNNEGAKGAEAGDGPNG
jgi:hypothetical protein